MPITGSDLLKFSGNSQNPGTTQTPGGLTGSSLIHFINNPPAPQPKNNKLTADMFPKESISWPQQGQNFLQQTDNTLSNLPVIGGVYKTGKDILSQLPQAPGYVAAAVKDPLTSAAGAGEALIEFGGSIAGHVEKGIASALNLTVPERYDILKQVQALKELDNSLAKKHGGMDEQKAFDTGRFVGAMIPYSLGGELVGATLGTRVLGPLAARFLPAATRFLPVINNAIGFIGVGQIEHDESSGSRVDQLKNDLSMLAFFEITHFAVGKVSSPLSKATKKTVSSVVNKYSGKFKAGEDIPLEKMESDIAKAKEAIQQDTGKTPEAVIANDIATHPEDSTLPYTKKSTGKAIDYALTEGEDGAILTPKSAKTEEISKTSPQLEGRTVDTTPQTDTTVKSEPVKPTLQTDELNNPIGTGKVKKSRLYERMKEHLKDELPPEALEKDYKYNTLNLEKQAKTVVDLIEKEPEKALRIANGLEDHPNVTTYSMRQAFAEMAKESKDWESYAKYSSKATLGLTRAGQEIVSARGRFDATDPQNFIRQIINNKMREVTDSYKNTIAELVKKDPTLDKKSSPAKKANALIKKEAAKLRDDVVKETVTKKSLQDILEELKCK